MSDTKFDMKLMQPRRNFIRFGVASSVAAGYGLLQLPTGNAQTTGNSGSGSGTTRMRLDPFLEPLPIPPVKQPQVLVPPPSANPVTGLEAGRLPHQAFARFPPQVTYALFVKPAKHRFHPHLPEQDIWGYDGMLPGPTLVNWIGKSYLVRNYNELPQNPIGFGSPEISTHLHGGHTPAESDGYAGDYFSRFKAGPTLPGGPGLFYDYHYPAFPANGDPNNITNTLWYHDHREEFTAANVYKGLAGFALQFDELDSNNETDLNPAALRLPSGVGIYDIPLLLQDKKFDASGNLFFDPFDPEGFVGDQFLVNGKIQPFFNVEARKYRFRLLNGNPTRFFEMYLADERDRDQAFTLIASDGNLLPEPVVLTRIWLGMAERADVIIDFAKYVGQTLYLVNRLKQDDPRGPDEDRMRPGIRMLQFRVGGPPAQPDQSRIPKQLRPLAPINVGSAVQRRHFVFERGNGQWQINDKFFDPERIDAAPKQGVPEIWTFEAKGGGWAHPIHVHLDDFRILSLNGRPPPREWAGRKDVVSLKPNDVARIFVTFTNYTGKYMMHCHNTVHEDHAMMIRYDVVF